MLEISIKTDNIFFKKGLQEIIRHIIHKNDFIKIIDNCTYKIKHHNDINVSIYDDVAIVATGAHRATSTTNDDLFERHVFTRNDQSTNELKNIRNLFFDVAKKDGFFFNNDAAMFKYENLARRDFHKISLREKITFFQTGNGLSNEQIASLLGCSVKSIYNYKKSLIKKHHFRSKYHLYKVATNLNENITIQKYNLWVIYNINFMR